MNVEEIKNKYSCDFKQSLNVGNMNLPDKKGKKIDVVKTPAVNQETKKIIADLQYVAKDLLYKVNKITATLDLHKEKNGKAKELVKELKSLSSKVESF